MQQQRGAITAVIVALACLLAMPAMAQVDHTSFITGPITSGPEATQKCLECHEDQAMDFMKTSHWNWALEQEVHGKEVFRGKRDAINNFCTSVSANEIFCSGCHAGYGMEDVKTFDFTDKTKIDCLVCHDNTGTYKKAAGTGGMPASNLDLLNIAQNVGMPVRDNCGTCHFFGGGGDAVKHGDLDSSMSYPDRATDVHMDADGPDFQCQECHKTANHQITGNSLGVSPTGNSHFGCTQCHEAAPHAESRLNDHAEAVACQTCHIPYFAKNIATKMSWDWSTAGDDAKEHAADNKDKYGKHTYVKKKGTFEYGKMVQPEYAWYQDGAADAYLPGEKMDPTKVTKLAYPTSTIKDKEAKIYPFKVHRGQQIYDKNHKVFITAKVYGNGGYWKDFDWDKAAKLGMEENPIMIEKGLKYSGEYGFAPTEMYWRINHMVSPAEDALKCLDCHGDNGRMDWKALGYKGDPMSNKKWARK